jgi:glycolate oxidase
MDVKAISRVLGEIGRRIGQDKVQTAPEILTCYSFDATNMKALPAAVLFPDSPADVRAISQVCYKSGIIVIPRGAGTGFAGGTIPFTGGVVVSTEKLNRIVHIDAAQRTAIVQAGVVNAALQREVAKFDLMFPPDPSSMDVSTLGGNVAQDAGGPRALKYGVTRDYVSGVDLVTSDGRMIEWRAGGGVWNPITTLLTGSEGTLGVMTAMALRLLSRPKSFETVLAFFETTVAAAAAVSRILDCGILPAAVELMDRETMDCVRSFVEVRIPKGAGCSLLIETDGRDGEAAESMAAVEGVIDHAGTMGFTVASSDGEREDLWKMRRSISPSLARIAPSKVNEDVCVPRSRLPDLVDSVGRLGRKYALKVPTFGHAGDGNLHVNVMLNRKDQGQLKRAEALVAELFEITIGLGGSISGEHGIGVTKLRFLPEQLGPEGLALQSRIKQSFDPRSLINPGKVIQ